MTKEQRNERNMLRDIATALCEHLNGLDCDPSLHATVHAPRQNWWQSGREIQSTDYVVIRVLPKQSTIYPRKLYHGVSITIHHEMLAKLMIISYTDPARPTMFGGTRTIDLTQPDGIDDVIQSTLHVITNQTTGSACGDGSMYWDKFKPHGPCSSSGPT